MTAFEERALGPAAVEYVRARLAQGMTLCRKLLDCCEFDSGSVTAFVPPEATAAEAEEFDEGHASESPEEEVAFTSATGAAWRMVRKPTADPNLAAAIRAFFDGAPRGVAVFEHALARRGDPFLEDAASKVAFAGDEVYPFAAAGDDVAAIGAAIRAAATTYPPMVGAMTHGDLAGQRVELTEADVVSLAAETEKIIVGAYDGEGYVIWSAQPP